MKTVNEPVKATVIFNTGGKFEPVNFVLDDKNIVVEKIIETREENFVGNKRIVFVCQHKEKYRYELKYEVGSGIWYLFLK